MNRSRCPPPYRISLLAGIALLLAGAGCERRVLWSYRDDPYFAPLAAQPDKHCLRMFDSFYTDDRRLALRLLAYRARAARLNGDTTRARRLVGQIIEQFAEDKSTEVRECILRVCLPECGAGSVAAERFLRRLIAQGRWATEACLALAAIRPAKGASLLVPLTRHPSPRVRYQGALALSALADPAGREAVERVVAEMTRPAWPSSVCGRPLARARADLRRRARRLWGRGAAVSTPAGGDAPPAAEAITERRDFRPRPGPALPKALRVPAAPARQGDPGE